MRPFSPRSWLTAGLLLVCGCLSLQAAERPNILWLTSEDHGPHLGCYGFDYADTPNIDALAKRGMKFAHCWSNFPVCAPARTTLITGLYANSTGAEHMRSQTNLPDGFSMFPQLLRAGGYYCTNNNKEDYNLTKPGKVWDESSKSAHWQKRAADQPFFAVFNSTESHESQLRGKPAKPKHDPAQVRLPAYHPDLPEVRHEWAHYHDNVTKIDAAAGERLAEIAAAGLADDTIVFCFSDHGSGMPRNKRSACDSGLHVPLVVYFPDRWKHLAPASYAAGGTSEQLVSFVDFAPTILSIAGIEAPQWMQGVAFAGQHRGEPHKYQFGARGRMDEREDCVRSATDGRYVYVRNFLPHLPHGQHNAYMFQTQTTALWKQLFDAGKTTPDQSLYWQRRQPEELYDLQNDPDEIHNLAGKPAHAEKLEELRAALHEHQLAICDVGMLPEDEIHTRSEGSSPYEMAHDAARYPLPRILAMAEAAANPRDDDSQLLTNGLADDDSAVRYWAALGCLMRTDGAAATDNRAALVKQLQDPAPAARIAAAAALAEHTSDKNIDGEPQAQALQVLLKHADPERNSIYISTTALNLIDNLGAKASTLHEPMRRFSRTPGQGRSPERIARLLNDILGAAR